MTILTACSKQTPVQLTTNSDNMIPTDWKTFTSSNLDDNFEIRYPSNWKVEERNHIVSFAPRDFDWLKTTDEN